MRHKVFGKKLNRNSGHRKALFKNLAREFFKNRGQVNTTLAKAKAVHGLIEKMITRAIKADLVSRRWLFKFFQDQTFVNQIVNTFGKQFKGRSGGYLRMVRVKKRKGDDAVIVRLEIVETLIEEEKKVGTKKKK